MFMLQICSLCPPKNQRLATLWALEFLLLCLAFRRGQLLLRSTMRHTEAIHPDDWRACKMPKDASSWRPGPPLAAEMHQGS
jgi:hypothetical protein